MSRPGNVLDAYRSYNYHHILIACDSSDTAERLADQSEITLFDHEDVTSEDQSRFNVQNIPGEIDSNYIVLINGASDTYFTIQTARWQAVTTPSGEHEYSSTTLEGQMKIQEPKGARFLNVIQHAARDLGASPMGMVFVLKTIFVGHTDGGYIESLTTVRPLLLTMIDIQTQFDVTGATYEIAFVGNAGGASKMPQVSSVTDGFSFTIEGSGQTLEQTMNKLETSLNTRYNTTKERLKFEAKCAGVTLDFDDSFMPVTYEINLDPAYRKMKAGTATREQQENTGQQDPVIVQQGESMSVESLINQIMLTSQEVYEDGNPDEGDKKFIHKISASVKPNKTEYRVVYNVHRYEVRFPGQSEQQAEDTNDNSGFNFDPEEGTSIEFDYIFTGKNIDVLDFNMKMEMGLAFLQTLASTPSLMSASETQSSNQESTTGAKSAEQLTSENSNVKKPLFLGMKLKDPALRNHINPGETTTYNALLSRWAGYETLEASVTIRGNPQLLHESTPKPDSFAITDEDTEGLIEGQQPQNVSVITSDAAANLPEEQQPNTVMPRYWRRPGFVKVNVRFPTVTTQFGQDALTEPFWYTGYYYLISVDNIFEEGQFRQELDIMSLPSNVGNIMSFGKKCDATTLQTVGGVGGAVTPVGGGGGDSVGGEEGDQEKKSTRDVDTERNESTDVGVIFPEGGGA